MSGINWSFNVFHAGKLEKATVWNHVSPIIIIMPGGEIGFKDHLLLDVLCKS